MPAGARPGTILAALAQGPANTPALSNAATTPNAAVRCRALNLHRFPSVSHAGIATLAPAPELLDNSVPACASEPMRDRESTSRHPDCGSEG